MIRLFIFCSLLLASTTAALAQDINAVLQSAAKRNWYVRVTADSTASWVGRAHLDDGSIQVGGSPIPVERIRTIERRTNFGGGWRTGAVIGTVTGAGFGVMLAGLCEYDCGGQGLIGALVFGGVGALLGGVTGQIVRPPRHRWNPVWP